MDRLIDVIGVPFDSAGTTDGVARAPAALRRAALVEAIREAGVQVVDRGDVKMGPTSPDRDPASGIIAPAALTAMIRATRSSVQASLARGAFPVVVGGDCPVLLGCLPVRGAGGQRGLLFLDGHEDAWPPLASTTGEAADMELGLLLGITTASVPDPLRRELPLLTPDDVVVLGARDQDELTEAGVPSVEDIVKVVRPAELAADPDGAAAAACAHLARRGPWWLHVDLDVLSTASLAAVDYRRPGGIDWETLTQLTRTALASPGVVGWTVTIFNPDLDPDGSGASRIVRFAAESLRA